MVGFNKACMSGCQGRRVIRYAARSIVAFRGRMSNIVRVPTGPDIAARSIVAPLPCKGAPDVSVPTGPEIAARPIVALKGRLHERQFTDEHVWFAARSLVALKGRTCIGRHLRVIRFAARSIVALRGRMSNNVKVPTGPEIAARSIVAQTAPS